jgi:hypothetical protein
MTALDPGPEILRNHFQGKRQGVRIPFAREAVLVGPEGEVRGRTVDLSDGGVQIEVVDDRFASAAPVVLMEAERAFRGTVRIAFPPADGGPPLVEVEAEVVRLTFDADGTPRLRAGCRFTRPLGEEEMRRLRAAAGPERRFPFVPRRGHAVFALLYGAANMVAGPLCVAPVLGMDGARWAVRAQGAGLDALIQRGPAAPVRMVVMDGPRRVFESETRLATATSDGDAEGGAVVELQGDREPDADVRRIFRPA